jgi:LacI family transcriptional regulator
VSEIRRIALLMGQDIGYCRGVLRGIYAYSVDKPDWIFRDGPPVKQVLGSLREWQPHGIIAHLYDRQFARALIRTHRRIVNTTSTLEDLRVPLVEVDHVEVGRLAAEHFLERRFTHFGYFGSAWTGFSKQREAGFRRRLDEAGHTASSCYAEYLPRPPAGASWKEVDNRVKTWLERLPKPAAVLASNDIPARHLSHICHQLGFRVPDDIALLGVDNDELECHLASPPLSSVVNPAEQIGFQAARILDELLQGKPRPTRPYCIRPDRIVTRQSTDTVAIHDADVSAAVAYIRRHVSDRVDVAAVCEALSLSRRKLERKFHSLLGRTVLAEIQKTRIERAKTLLAETDLSVAAVARRSGFGKSDRQAVVFRQLTGLTPTEFRRRCQDAHG